MLNHITSFSHTFGARATEHVHIYPTQPTRGRALIFPDNWIKDFKVSQVLVEGKPQTLPPQPAPNPDRPVTNWRMVLDVAQSGETITLVVTNESDQPRVFQGALRSDVLTSVTDAFEEILPEPPPPTPPAHRFTFSVPEQIKPSSIGKIRITLPSAMIIRRVEVPAEIAPFFVINKFDMNGQTQFKGADPERSLGIPASMFSSKAVEIEPLDIEAHEGDVLEIEMQNDADTESALEISIDYDDLTVV
jgi:hypothetical protein